MAACFDSDQTMNIHRHEDSSAEVESINVSLYNIHDNNEHKDADRRKSWES